MDRVGEATSWRFMVKIIYSRVASTDDPPIALLGGQQPKRLACHMGGRVKSAGGICQDVPKLPGIGSLFLFAT